MPNMLAIDTSTRELILGLQFGDDRLIKSSERIEKSHGQFIIKKIGELLQSAGAARSDISAVTVCTGPGSFTGLRIGLAAAKGICMALDIPLIDVTAFEIAAYRLRDVESVVNVVMPLGRDEGIIARVEAGRWQPESITVVAYRLFVDQVGAEPVAAIGFSLYERFPEIHNEDYSDRLNLDAADLIHLGAQKLAAGYRADPATLEPYYVRRSYAEEKLEQG